MREDRNFKIGTIVISRMGGHSVYSSFGEGNGAYMNKNVKARVVKLCDNFKEGTNNDYIQLIDFSGKYYVRCATYLDIIKQPFLDYEIY